MKQQNKIKKGKYEYNRRRKKENVKNRHGNSYENWETRKKRQQKSKTRKININKKNPTPPKEAPADDRQAGPWRVGHAEKTLCLSPGWDLDGGDKSEFAASIALRSRHQAKEKENLPRQCPNPLLRTSHAKTSIAGLLPCLRSSLKTTSQTKTVRKKIYHKIRILKKQKNPATLSESPAPELPEGPDLFHSPLTRFIGLPDQHKGVYFHSLTCVREWEWSWGDTTRTLEWWPAWKPGG